MPKKEKYILRTRFIMEKMNFTKKEKKIVLFYNNIQILYNLN